MEVVTCHFDIGCDFQIDCAALALRARRPRDLSPPRQQSRLSLGDFFGIH